MAITIEQVEYIAKLAKLQFSESEKEKLSRELSEILVYMDKLNELNTEEIEPLNHTNEIRNVMREDRVEPSLPNEEAVRNAPAKQDNYFKVPKVIK